MLIALVHSQTRMIKAKMANNSLRSQPGSHFKKARQSKVLSFRNNNKVISRPHAIPRSVLFSTGDSSLKQSSIALRVRKTSRKKYHPTSETKYQDHETSHKLPYPNLCADGSNGQDNQLKSRSATQTFFNINLV